MANCSFCKSPLTPGTGVMLVKKDGKIFYFCSSKCEKNLLKLKRKPQNQKWVKRKND
jgi:large subunit ribosomal protein L24e